MADLVFRIQEPGRPAREVPVNAGMTLGRDPRNSCVFQDQNVSGRHSTVVTFEGRLVIEDLGSSNKTRIAGG